VYGKLLKLTTKPGKRDEVLKFLRWDADIARDLEPGTLRFDVWNVPSELDAVYLYEAYRDFEAYARHQDNEPYKRFINEIEPKLLDDTRVLFDGTSSLISIAD
jgi:quinol monooxygenase YgiN